VTTFAPPVVASSGEQDVDLPLVVLLHGRGPNEGDIVDLADHLPVGPAYAAVRVPIAEGDGYAWFANRGIGRPVAGSLADTMPWFRTWLDDAWTYLHDDAGSTTSGVRDQGGHGISAAAVGKLKDWLADVTAKRAAL
jgi:predicted esterase